MKIPYEHLLKKIETKPSIKELSDKLFQLGHEHEIFGQIFDVEFTPNRGDCLSLNGILRDLKLFYKINIIDDYYKLDINPFSFEFQNNAEKYCSNISFLKIEIDELPKKNVGYIDEYFQTTDSKKNNFFTDISNYLSYETGQPTHCYDSQKLGNSLRLDFLREKCEFETLLGNIIKLNKGELVFLNNSNKVVNFAGVIGGKNTSCDKNTKSVIIECAHFDPEKILNKSVKYNINSDAAHKFERGTDPNCHDYVLRRFIKIIEDYTKIKKIEIFSQGAKTYSPKQIPFDVLKINKILGTNIDINLCSEYLKNLCFSIKDELITVPSHRTDINSINDISEEIARAFGYNNIANEQINISINDGSHDENLIEESLKDLLVSKGFYEVINNPFVSEKNDNSIVVDNPLDSNKNYLRTCLKQSLINNLQYNERRQHDSIKLFEISNIYSSDINKNKRVLAIIASGRVDKNYKDFSNKIDKNYISSIFDNVIDSENLNLSFISRDNLKSKLTSPIIYSEININSLKDIDLSHFEKKSKKIKKLQYIQISDFPSSVRDLSFSVKEPKKSEELVSSILGFNHELLKEKFIFDYYYNEKILEVKIGFRFIFQSSESTITDNQVNNVIEKIIKITRKIDSVSIPGIN